MTVEWWFVGLLSVKRKSISMHKVIIYVTDNAGVQLADQLSSKKDMDAVVFIDDE